MSSPLHPSPIIRMIREGEHQHQDFKFGITDSRKIARSLVAFANSRGGRLLIGVKDNGRIVGVQSEEEYYMVESAALIFSIPVISFTTREWKERGKTVLQVDIPESQAKPHFVKEVSDDLKAYVRCEDQNLQANEVQLAVWKKQHMKAGTQIGYTKSEQFLFEYLEHHRYIDLETYIREGQVDRKTAVNSLSTLLVFGNLESFFIDMNEYYRLSE